MTPGNKVGQPIRVELDEGSKGHGASWITADAVKTFNLKRRRCENEYYFSSPLFPTLTYTPTEETDITLYFTRAETRITLTCYILPERTSSFSREQPDIRLGDAHIQLYNIREIMDAQEPLFTKAAEAPEILESINNLLFDDFGGIEQEQHQPTYPDWYDTICRTNFPLGSKERIQLQELLNRFEGTVLVDKLDGTPSRLPEMHAELKEGKSFEGVPPRNYTAKKKQIIRTWLDKMLEMKLIQKSTSRTTSPLLVCTDASGKHRITQDVTKLNGIMKRIHGNIPNIRDILEELGNHKYYSCGDLIKAYHQLRVSDSLRRLWAFSTPWGAYEYTNNACQGDSNVPVVFCDRMQKIIHDLPGVHAYFDDVPWSADTFQELYDTTEKVLQRMQEFNIRLSKEKLRIGFSKLDILGYEITEQGHIPRKRNLDKFLAEPFPTTATIRHYLGLLNVFSKFIPNYAEIIYPFQHALQKNSSLQDNEETRAAFIKAKEAIISIQQLYFLDRSQEIFLDTDASDYGVGYICYHKDKEGQMLPIRFGAHLLSQPATKWSTKKKECYAIYIALKELDYLLYGTEFVLRTDHANLLYLKESHDQVEHRFLQTISQFDFSLEHVPGVENIVADSLSRMFKTCESFGGINREHVIEYFKRTHNIDIGHLGINKTTDAVREIMTSENRPIPANLRSEVAELMSECVTCTKRKTRPGKPVLLPHALHAGRFFEKIELDFLEGLPESQGWTSILVIICTFSKFVMLFPIAEKSADAVKQCLLYTMGIFGAPRFASSDGGAAFKANEIDALFNYTGTDNSLTHPYRSSAHGTVERVHQEEMKHLGNIIHEITDAEPADWSTYLPWVQRIINNTPNRNTTFAPATIVFGHKHVFDSKMMEFTPITDTQEKADMNAYIRKHNEMLNRIQTIANKSLDERLLAQFRELNSKPQELSKPLEKDSYVLVKQNKKGKLQLSWTGPKKVVEMISDNFYKILDIVQDIEEFQHRENLMPIQCENDDIARDYARLDTNELTITEVLSHNGDPQRTASMIFTCLCKETADKHINFTFTSCKHVQKIKEYIQEHKELGPLKAKTHYKPTKTRKHSKKHIEAAQGYC